MIAHKEVGTTVLLERRPVATDKAVMHNNGLEDTTIVMGLVAEIR